MVLAAAAGIAALALAGCNGAKNAYVPPPPPKVAVAQPLQQPVTLYLNLTGNTSPFKSVDLVARVQGFLTDIDYVDGAAVKEGDKLFGIERDTYQAQLDQAKATLASNQATLAYNQAEYQRQAQLGKQDFASQATVQEWKSKADQAAAEVMNAQAAIEIGPDQSQLHDGQRAFRRGRHAGTSSTGARWSASGRRPGSHRSSSSTRSISISP